MYCHTSLGCSLDACAWTSPGLFPRNGGGGGAENLLSNLRLRLFLLMIECFLRSVMYIIDVWSISFRHCPPPKKNPEARVMHAFPQCAGALGTVVVLRRHLKSHFVATTVRLLSLVRHEPHRKRRVKQFFYCCVCVFVAAVTFLPTRCLATIVEFLPS
jgi:hypothetical protein